MSSRRIIERIGQLRVVGAGALTDFAHRFDKLGEDGTGKGNVIPMLGSSVHGVVYEIEPAQVEALDEYEGGYTRSPFRIQQGGNKLIEAISYMARVRFSDLLPSEDYFQHYRRGIEEHDLPADYAETLARQAKGEH